MSSELAGVASTLARLHAAVIKYTRRHQAVVVQHAAQMRAALTIRRGGAFGFTCAAGSSGLVDLDRDGARYGRYLATIV
jgi:hypothetical protein